MPPSLVNAWIEPIGGNTTDLATATLQSLGGLVTNTIVKREAYASVGGVECDPKSVAITLVVNQDLIDPTITIPIQKNRYLKNSSQNQYRTMT